jgi:hypothetical protein|tara:strand:+ start:150 stop:1304 length:1155 start_codon:yes stop_codon:yes gene_type:complete
MTKKIKKQGAGTSIEHYIQDAAEIRLTALLQEEAERRGVASKNISSEINEDFVKICVANQIQTKFFQSKYSKNIDATYQQIVQDFIEQNPGRKFHFECVEVEFRNLGRKGDIIIVFDDGETKKLSVAVKNYQNGFDTIQVCSGTFNSTLNNFLFDDTDCVPGTYITSNGEKFTGRDREQRDRFVKESYPELLPYYAELDSINDDIRNFYINSKEAEYYENVEDKWKEDCSAVGNKVASLMVEALSHLPNEMILNRLQKATGLVSDEHLLCLGKGKYLFSVTNPKYQKLCDRVKEATHVEIVSKGQSVFYHICDDEGTIISINQPCTLQKNGAWFATNEEKFDGLREKNDKGKKFMLKWGQRRPRKSKELATSTNMYLKLKDSVV